MSSPSNTTASSTLLALVSLGSNLACSERTPAQLVLAAMDRLRQLGSESLASSLYRSEPLDCPAGSADFINAVMALQLPADTRAKAFLAATQEIENAFGRRRGAERNQPRTLDIDIISFGNQVLVSEELSLPHPRACEREFVLAPLCEICPSLVLPGQTVSVAQLLQGLPAGERVRRLG